MCSILYLLQGWWWRWRWWSCWWVRWYDHVPSPIYYFTHYHLCNIISSAGLTMKMKMMELLMGMLMGRLIRWCFLYYLSLCLLSSVQYYVFCRAGVTVSFSKRIFLLLPKILSTNLSSRNHPKFWWIIQDISMVLIPFWTTSSNIINPILNLETAWWWTWWKVMLPKWRASRTQSIAPQFWISLWPCGS